MSNKKLQVFVSSTFTDLKEERQAAVEAILQSGHIPAGMELFAAGDETQMAVIKRWIDESDVYLLILGGRYGSIEPKTGKSYTHLEYEYALEKGKPLFAVVISEDALDAKVEKDGRKVLEQDDNKGLKEFKALVLKNLVKFWDKKEDIQLAIFKTISEFSRREELVGWIRGDNAANNAIVAEELARLTKENDELREKVESRDNNALYVGFSYKQLEDILKREELLEYNPERNAFDFLLRNGESLINNKSFSIEKSQGINVLHRYGLVLQVQWMVGSAVYRFTNDGHMFYLKALHYHTKPNSL